MAFLITGASGFVGSRLAEFLVNDGNEVYGLSHDVDPNGYFAKTGLGKRMLNIIGSIEDQALVERIIIEHNIVHVFHLAAISSEGAAFKDPLMAFNVNIKGTYTVLHACLVHKERIKSIVVASSDKVYGDSEIQPYVESLPLRGIHPYDVSKACADMISQSYHYNFDLPIIIGRFGNIYGGGDPSKDRVVPKTIRRINAGENPIIRVPQKEELLRSPTTRTSPVFQRDFLHIDDTVSAYVAMHKHAADNKFHGEIYNFSYGLMMDVPQIVYMIINLMGSKLVPEMVLQSHGEIISQHVSSAKARSQLNWLPIVDLQQGLMEAINYYTNESLITE